MQYLVGSFVLDIVQSGIRLLAAEPQVPEAALEELRTAVGRWAGRSGPNDRLPARGTVPLRPAELERFAACPDVVSLVDQFLERHYPNAPLLSGADDESETGAADDGRRAWRRRACCTCSMDIPSRSR